MALPEFLRHLEPRFLGFNEVVSLGDELFARNESKVHVNTRRYATGAAMGLYPKARRAIDALRLLAGSGYGAEAVVLARSMVNTCIDLRYICGDADHAEARARCWIANGRLSEQALRARWNVPPRKEERVDWAEERKFADEWRKVTIDRRATEAGLQTFYDTYRDGSSVEHSDAFSVAWFLEITDDRARMQVQPSADWVEQSLVMAAASWGEISMTFAKFYQFAVADSEERLLAAFKSGFDPETRREQNGA